MPGRVGEVGGGLYDDHHIAVARQAFNGELPWLDFLKSFSGPLVKEMVGAAAQISVVRSSRCLELAKRL